jgi:hypothetical protein
MSMSDFTGMFDDGSDLDARLEAASHMLKQAADEEGVDLNQFSEEELGDMIGNLADDDGGQGDEGYEGKTASDITVADVSLELHKRAAAEDFDLTQLHPQEYSELFDKVAAELTDPYVAEENQKLAAQAANMDELGRIAARGFVDEINKIAADEEHPRRRRDDDDEDEVDIKVKKAQQLLKEANWAGDAYRSAKGRVGGAVSRVKHEARKLHGKAKDKYTGTIEGAKKKYEGHLNESGGREMMRQSGQSRSVAFGPGISGEERRFGGVAKGRGRIEGAAGATGLIGASAAGHHAYKNRDQGGRRGKHAGLEDAGLVADAIEVLRAAGYDL